MRIFFTCIVLLIITSFKSQEPTEYVPIVRIDYGELNADMQDLKMHRAEREAAQSYNAVKLAYDEMKDEVKHTIEK